MNRARWIVLLLAASFVLASNSQAVAKVLLACSDGGENVRVLNLADLRSAFLLRAGFVDYDPAHVSPEGIRRQLQRHFDTVIGLLERSTQQSVEIALDRLEAERGSHWSPKERAAERERLLASRLLQIERLIEYRDHGLFPQNEGQSGGAVPVFVDRHDTACAVGQLMRLSGWQDAVAAVERSNNLVYVPDAAKSVVDRWVLQSGLTLEEAALIQPGYQFLGVYNFSQYGPGGATIEE